MMIQRRRPRSPTTPNPSPRSKTKGVSSKLRQELLTQIAAGNREFEVDDQDSIADVEEFQHRVQTLEALAAEGLITIGTRQTAATATPPIVLAVRRIRLTEAGKRRLSASGPEDRASDSDG